MSADGTFKLGYDLSRLESDGHRAALMAQQQGATIARRHAEAAQSFMSGFRMTGIGDLMMGAIGGGTIIGATAALKNLAAEYTHLVDLAARFDTTGESMQRLKRMADLTGTSVDSIVARMQRFAIALENVDDPKIAAALDELRLSAIDLAGVGPERQLALLAEAFNAAQREGRGLSATKDLLGKGFGELIPILREYEQVSRQAGGGVIREDDLQRLKQYEDAWVGLKSIIKDVTIGTFMGVINDLAAPAAHGIDPEEALRRIKGRPSQTEDKEAAEKAAVKQRIEAAAAEKTRKAIEAAREDERKLDREVAEARKRAMEEEMSPAEKLANLKARLAELEAQINYSRREGPQQVGAVQRLELERYNTLRAISVEQRRQNELLEEAARKESAAAKAAMDRADAGRRAVADNAAARGDALAELAILEAKASGRNKEVQNLERAQRIQADMRKFMELGMDAETARQHAERMEVARDRIANPGKIRGYHNAAANDSMGKITGSFPALEEMDRKRGAPIRGEWQFPALDKMKQDRLGGRAYEAEMRTIVDHLGRIFDAIAAA